MSEVLVSVVEGVGEVVRAVAGSGQVRGGEADEFGRVGVGVGSHGCGVVFVMQPAAELVE
jgi:hypothetical protein